MQIKNRCFFVAVVIGLLGLVIFPRESAEAVRGGLQMCGTSVIPALFPFFVLTKFWLSFRTPKEPSARLDRVMRRLFGIAGSGFSALLLSFVGGYPVGVSTAVGLYESGQLHKRDAERLLRFCNNSGPAFFVGILGGVVLQSVKLGLLLFGTHILSALCCGLLFAESAQAALRIRRTSAPPVSASDAFLGAVGASCASLLQISGLILCFCVVLALLDACGVSAVICRLPLGLAPQEIKAVLCGLLELSGGILRLQDTAHAPVLAAFLMGWGGLCVHLQAMSLWQAAKLHPRGYFLSKLLQGLFSALFVQAVLSPTPVSVLLSGTLVCICCIFSFARKKQAGNLYRFPV